METFRFGRTTTGGADGYGRHSSRCFRSGRRCTIQLVSQLIDIDTNGKLNLIDTGREQIQLGIELGDGRRRGIDAAAVGFVEISSQQVIDGLGLRRDAVHHCRSLPVGEPGVALVRRKGRQIEWL